MLDMRRETIIDTELQEEVEDLRENVKDLCAENKLLQARIAKRDAEIERLREVISGLVDLVNNSEPVTLAEDFGGNTLTICTGPFHTHCGVPDGGLDILIDHLHNLLVNGTGLIWAVGGGDHKTM